MIPELFKRISPALVALIMLAIALIPDAAMAQEASGGGGILAALWPALLAFVGGATFLGYLAKGAIALMKQTKLLEDQRRSDIITIAIEESADAVERISRKTPNVVDDKFALFLRKLEANLKVDGIEVTDDIVEAAKVKVDAKLERDDQMKGVVAGSGDSSD